MNFCDLWKRMWFKISHLNPTEGKPHHWNAYWGTSILWKSETPGILEENLKHVKLGASGQRKQPVKYNQIPDECHQTEELYRMRNPVRKKFRADCHCDEWFVPFWGCNSDWKNQAEVPDWHWCFTNNTTHQICQRTPPKPNTSPPILNQRWLQKFKWVDKTRQIPSAEVFLLS